MKKRIITRQTKGDANEKKSIGFSFFAVYSGIVFDILPGQLV